MDGEVGDVHVEVTRAHVARHPAHPLEVDGELRQPRRDRRVDRGERRLADDAVVDEAVLALEALDGGLEPVVELRGDGLAARRQVAEAGEAGAELGDARIVVAGVQGRAVGDLGAPAPGPGKASRRRFSSTMRR